MLRGANRRRKGKGIEEDRALARGGCLFGETARINNSAGTGRPGGLEPGEDTWRRGTGWLVKDAAAFARCRELRRLFEGLSLLSSVRFDKAGGAKGSVGGREQDPREEPVACSTARRCRHRPQPRLDLTQSARAHVNRTVA